MFFEKDIIKKTLHHIISHHITLHHNTLAHHTTSHHVIISQHTTSHHITSHHSISHQITSDHITFYHTLHHITSHLYHIISHHNILFPSAYQITPHQSHQSYYIMLNQQTPKHTIPKHIHKTVDPRKTVFCGSAFDP